MSMNIRHPHITEGTPAMQIGQIRSYLYQLSDQLNWALGYLERMAKPQSEGNGFSEAELREGLQSCIRDYIFEVADLQTDYGTWHLERFDSGRCGMSGCFTVVPKASELQTVWYRSESFLIPLPAGVENPVVIATAKGCCFVESEGVRAVEETVDEQITQKHYVSFRLVSDAQFPTDAAVEVGLSVTGTYLT